MYRAELQKLEGVWTGTERVFGEDGNYDATGRMVFQTVFDGRFLLCDYVQTAVDRPTAVAHGVFRKDDRSNALTVSWFRSPVASSTQQAHATAEGDRLIFQETCDGRSTRTTYSVTLNRLTIIAESSVRGGAWKQIFEGSYRRR
jgi:hypothetical protein